MTQPDPPPAAAIADPAAAAAVAALQAQVQQLAARFVALAGFAAGRAEESDPAAASPPPEAAGPSPGEAAPGGAQPEEPEPEEPAVERAWWWPCLSGEDTAQAAERLGRWVEHALLARHPHYGKTLLPCWWRHPGVVDELSALRAVWHGAYAAPDRTRPRPRSTWPGGCRRP